jgi:hypothetical protein
MSTLPVLSPKLNPSTDSVIVDYIGSDSVRVSVIIPERLVNDFSILLKTMLRVSGSYPLDFKSVPSSRLLASSSDSPDLQSSLCLKAKSDFYARIVPLYDFYISQGFSRTSSIKRISQELSAEKHPWSSIDLVRISLVEAGRPRKSIHSKIIQSSKNI